LSVFWPDGTFGSKRWKKVLERLGLEEPAEARDIRLDQTALFGQVCRFLRRISGTVRLILAIDNLHLADDSSVTLFFYLARELGGTRVLLIASYQPSLLSKGRKDIQSLRALINDVRRYGARRISLDLSTTKAEECQRIQEFVVAYLGRALPGHRLPPWVLEKLVEYSGGNALFLTAR